MAAEICPRDVTLATVSLAVHSAQATPASWLFLGYTTYSCLQDLHLFFLLPGIPSFDDLPSSRRMLLGYLHCRWRPSQTTSSKVASLLCQYSLPCFVLPPSFCPHHSLHSLICLHLPPILKCKSHYKGQILCYIHDCIHSSSGSSWYRVRPNKYILNE